jgi:hypothetical protein
MRTLISLSWDDNHSSFLIFLQWNPNLNTLEQVLTSSIEKGNPIDLVGRKSKELWTKDVPSSWFAIDLGPNRTVVPSYYSLQHGGSYKSDCLRNWDFQGVLLADGCE